MDSFSARGKTRVKGKPIVAAPASVAGLRRTVARIVAALEGVYGIPQSGRNERVLDSLVGCILSQNTNDLNSWRAWRNLKRRLPTWRKCAEAPVDEIRDAIRVGGLAPVKSRQIKEILMRVKATHGAYSLQFVCDMEIDGAFEYLTAMNGVGVKTAAVVLLFACGRDVFPVDTHIHRIAQRLGLVREGATRDEVFRAMRDLVPAGKALSLHINLIRFGRERCRKRGPDHEGCPLRRGCLYVKGLVKY
jgi:endonuclease III